MAFIFVLLASSLCVNYAKAAVPSLEIIGSKFFTSDNNEQFYIKGVVYTPYINGAHQDPLINATQCAIDAPVIRALGANLIRVFIVDLTKSHEECMNTFADNGIYALIDVHPTIRTDTEPEWTLALFQSYSAVLDQFASHDNLLGLNLYDWDRKASGSSIYAPSTKAAIRDLKAYRIARGYRKIPIGIAVDHDPSGREQLVDYMVCGGNAAEAADFVGFSSYSWCGNSSITLSGYDQQTERFSGLPVPIFFSEDGCNDVSPREFTDQAAIFGDNSMEDAWSGAIIYEWHEGYPSNNYGLVDYLELDSLGTPGHLGSPATLKDYANLQQQWETLTPAGKKASSYTPDGTTPACPTTDSSWLVDPAKTLPTIAALNLATVSPVTGSSSGSGGPTFSGSSPANTDSGSSASTSSGGRLSIGAIVGIVVGVAVLLIAGILIFYLRHRPKKRVAAGKVADPLDSSDHGKPELYAGPVDMKVAGSVRPKYELSGKGPNAKTTVSEMASRQVESISHELHVQTKLNAPWRHTTDGHLPPELNSSPIHEAGVASLWQNPTHGISNNTARSSGGPGAADDASTTTGKEAPESEARSSTLFDDNELAEEADIAVQELGLVSVRKRALTNQAGGQDPATVEGRKGEEYRDLVRREERLRARLEEIEKQRNGER